MRPDLHSSGMGKAVRLTAPAAFLVALVAGLVAMAVSEAWAAGFSGADEPAHFLNSWFVAQYLQQALGSDPMGFAAEYYLHYPKISIGHWPPAFYALLSPFLLIFPASPETAFALNLLISSLPALFAAMLLSRLDRPAIALACALAVSLTPVAVEGYSFFMLDQAIAAAALGATILWLSHAERPRPWKGLGFALISAAAVLIKGNAWLLLFVPPIHLLLTGHWQLLRSPWPWLAGLLAALIVGPWYWLTAGISADGFNYAPGLEYAWQALRFNGAALFANLGLALPLALWALVRGWRGRKDAPQSWNMVAGCAALAAATLLIQSLVPVDLDARYMAPALPPLLILAFLGLSDLLPRHRYPALLLGTFLILLPGIAHLAWREPKIDLRLGEAAAALASPSPSAWVIDGTSGAEGAFIAAMAVRDPALQSYAIRSSRLLAESDFMGAEYKLAAAAPAEILARLETLGVNGIVLARIGNQPAFPHSALLRQALASPASPYRLVAALPHRNRPGVTEIYRLPQPAAMNAPAIRALGLPSKAGAVLR